MEKVRIHAHACACSREACVCACVFLDDLRHILPVASESPTSIDLILQKVIKQLDGGEEIVKKEMVAQVH